MKFLAAIDRGKLAGLSAVLAVIIFLAVNIFANTTFRGLEVDLTEENLFTLNDGTREILQNINEPITVRLFVSKRLTELNPGHATYADRVRELLERYVDISGGKIQLELYSPEPFTDEVDLAVSFGLQGVPLDNAGDLGYFGIVATNSVDNLERIAYLSPERESFLEYDLSKMIFKLAQDKKPLVGLIAGLPVAGGPRQQGGQAWAFLEQVREFFDITTIAVSDKAIPKDVDALLIVHPKGINDQLMYAIDQFVLKGGKAVVFVDENSEIDVAMARGRGNAGPSDFDKILNAWGVELVEGKVLGDVASARRVNVNLRGQTSVTDYVTWLSILPKHFKADDAITADLQRITLANAGILKPIADKGTTLEPLIQSSPQSMEIDVAKVRTNPDVVGMFREFKASGEQKTVAARVLGKPSSAFPDGRPALNESEVETPDLLKPEDHVAKADKDVSVVVVSDVDMLHEQFWMQSRQLFGQTFSVPFANNADFVVNSLENLSGGTALMSLRARSEAFRPFTYVDEVRKNAEQQFRTKEQQLADQIENIKTELANLLNREQAGGELVIGPEDKAKAEEYRREMVRLRKELRDVQYELRKDIDDLDALLKFINIAAIPLLLGVIALVWLFVGRARRARRYHLAKHEG
ncbi:MAG: Gldg family protein [Rhodospirillales bacterium]|nr:Gldg family protein [Rhodospirillales bacterium]MBO6787190.1 Gldg family protein [Rhodospirillales bacterium]